MFIILSLFTKVCQYCVKSVELHNICRSHGLCLHSWQFAATQDQYWQLSTWANWKRITWKIPIQAEWKDMENTAQWKNKICSALPQLRKELWTRRRRNWRILVNLVERPTNEAQHKHSQPKQNGNKPRKLSSKMKERYEIKTAQWQIENGVYWSI